MGYTHYHYRQKEIDLPIMQKIVEDFTRVAVVIDPYVSLAGGHGIDKPVITLQAIVFNGQKKCGHPKEDLGITWPSDDAGGIANPFKEKAANGSWFAGAQLQKRSCGGDCSHETMAFERIMTLQKWDEPKANGLYFEFCKTAFKPYDLAVIALLIIAKHYLKEKIVVLSDGTEEQWFDGKLLCNQVLGYGLDFTLDKD